MKKIEKIIKDEIASTLNLASLDPNEVVVFENRKGKLKSSNISLDDILVKHRGATENVIAVFSNQGKLKPDIIGTIMEQSEINY